MKLITNFLLEQTYCRNYSFSNRFVCLFSFSRNHLSKIYSPVVFCHNDLQQGNILRREDQPKHSSTGLVLIDFEYCSYNFRGFDLANHFIEWMYDYTNPEYPHYHVNKKNYCSVEQMVSIFILKFSSHSCVLCKSFTFTYFIFIFFNMFSLFTCLVLFSLSG